MKLSITLVQPDVFWLQPTENKKRLETLIEGIQTDILVLPETFLTGFAVNDPAIFLKENDVLEWMQDLSQKMDTLVMGSCAVELESKSILGGKKHHYNRFYIVEKDNYSHYDKIHLFTMGGEFKNIEPGDTFIEYRYKDHRIFPQICYDLRFPIPDVPVFDVLVYVANWPIDRIDHWDTLLKARAIENQCFTVGLNRVGEAPNGLKYNGHSQVYGPDGIPLISHPWETEGVQTVTLDFEFLKDYRNRLLFTRQARLIYNFRCFIADSSAPPW